MNLISKFIKYLFGHNTNKKNNYIIYLRGTEIYKAKSKEESERYIKELFKISENKLMPVNKHGITYNQRFKLFRSHFKIKRGNQL